MTDIDGNIHRWPITQAIVLLSTIAFIVASCGGGGGDSGRLPMVSLPPEIPIVPRDDHGDAQSDATMLSFDELAPDEIELDDYENSYQVLVLGEIEPGDDEDFFGIEVAEAGTLTIYTTGSLDTVGALWASDVSFLATDDDSGDQNNFWIELAVDPGAYYFGVSSYDMATGEYVLVARFVVSPPPSDDDHGNSRSDATALALGSSVAGRIETGGDEDFFAVEVTEPGALTVYTAGSLDTVGELQRGDGTRLAGDDDSGGQDNFRIEHDVGAGTYYVKVGSYSTATGGYVVLASFTASSVPPSDDHGDTRSDASPLALGGSVPGEIEEGGDEDFFRVEVPEPGTLAVYTTGSLDTVGELKHGDGTLLAGDDDSGSQDNFRIEHDVGAGTYYVKVGSFRQQTGTYTVYSEIETDNSDTIAGATSVPVGSLISGRINPADDVDYFRLRVAQTGNLTVWTTGEVETDLVLLDSAGNELRSAYSPIVLASPSFRRPMARPASTDGNVSTREIAVRAGTTVIAKVLGRGGIGSYTLGNRIIRVGLTNVVSGIPGISLSAGGSQRLDLTTHFDTSQAQGELTYSATIMGGGPVGLALTVSGSILTVISQESGLAFSGTVGIRVEVRDRFGLFAFKVIDMEFTRDGSTESRRVTIDGIDFPVTTCVSGHSSSDSNYNIPQERERCIEHIRSKQYVCGVLIFTRSYECLGTPEVSEKRAKCRMHFEAELPKCG